VNSTLELLIIESNIVITIRAELKRWSICFLREAF